MSLHTMLYLHHLHCETSKAQTKTIIHHYDMLTSCLYNGYQEDQKLDTVLLNYFHKILKTFLTLKIKFQVF